MRGDESTEEPEGGDTSHRCRRNPVTHERRPGRWRRRWQHDWRLRHAECHFNTNAKSRYLNDLALTHLPVVAFCRATVAPCRATSCDKHSFAYDWLACSSSEDVSHVVVREVTAQYRFHRHRNLISPALAAFSIHWPPAALPGPSYTGVAPCPDASERSSSHAGSDRQRSDHM